VVDDATLPSSIRQSGRTLEDGCDTPKGPAVVRGWDLGPGRSRKHRLSSAQRRFEPDEVTQRSYRSRRVEQPRTTSHST